MIVNSDNILQYLRKRNLVNEAEVVKGNYSIIPVKTRNDIMKIKVIPGHSLFVKQLATDQASGTLFKREVAAYHLFQKYPDTFTTSSSVPALLSYDNENNIMVTELLDEAQSLHEYYMQNRDFAPELARGQASLLAAYHFTSYREADTEQFPKVLPWIFQLDRHKAHEFFVNNEASTEVIGLIKEDALLQNNLIQLAKEWRNTHLIHGDIKWINFLVAEDGSGKIQKLIDWELADLGDPLWDVAGLLQSYISTWLFGFDNHNPQSQSLPENMEPYSLKYLQPSARAFLEEYMSLQQHQPLVRSLFLIKVMRYTAARILQTCIEGTSFHAKIKANNIRGVQLAHNIFKDPAYALNELLNITI